MLRKLMKYEMIAMGRILLPVYALVLCLAISINLSGRLFQDLADTSLLSVAVVLVGFGYIFACFAVCVISFVLMIRRFYVNLLGDEGYVMMTLPVSVHQHIMSKLLTACLWFCLTGGVVLLSILVTTADIDFPQALVYYWMGFWEEMRGFLGADDILFAIETMLVGLLGFASTCLQVYAALAIGHSFSGSKILRSVMAWLAGTFLAQWIGGWLLRMVTNLDPDLLAWVGELDSLVLLHGTMLTTMLSSLLYCAVCYGITAYFLKRKLNLA